MRYSYLHGILFLFLSLFMQACERLEPGPPKEEDVLDGPIAELSPQQMQQHLRGDATFTNMVFTPETGLGPLFVATSCAGCHAGDGKGHPFTALTRYGQWDSSGNHYLNHGGPQLQQHAIPGYIPEQMPPGVSFTRLIAPAVTGLGLLEAVDDAILLDLADQNDANGDGISGVPNWITLPSYVTPHQHAVSQHGKFIGRFGKKAAAYDLLMQTAKAYNQDMGILSVQEPVDPYSGLPGDPEISSGTLMDNVFYQRTLKAPPVRNQGDAQVQAGKTVFIHIGCASCHVPQLTTGNSPIAGLANRSFFPYTDMLLHDMGTGLDDGYTEGTAGTAEWRTAPLWGLGLVKNAQGGNCFLLHDGRATSIEQAILMHGGEGQGSNNRYQALSPSDKQCLLKFLESL